MPDPPVAQTGDPPEPAGPTGVTSVTSAKATRGADSRGEPKRSQASHATPPQVSGGARRRGGVRRTGDARRASGSQPVVLDGSDLSELFEVGRAAGLDLVGATRAAAWGHTRTQLERRRNLGLNADMAFTYKNPPRSTDATRVVKGAATLIVGARSYLQTDDAPPDPSIEVAAQVARYATADHYGQLAASLERVAEALRARGARAVVVLDRNDIVDREAAWRCGIGWYGKNSLLLAPGFGSWIVLGSVVTNARLNPDTAPVPTPVGDHCGTCRRCVDACPTGAIVADGVIDAGRCLSWLLQACGSFPVEHRVALGDRIYGCDDCQTACPPNRAVELRARRLESSDDVGSGPHRSIASPGRWMDAMELLNLDDEALLDRVGRWYIADRNPDLVRRNLLIVIANSAPADNASVRSVLEQFDSGADPMLSEHATWALNRLDDRIGSTIGSTIGAGSGTTTDQTTTMESDPPPATTRAP